VTAGRVRPGHRSPPLDAVYLHARTPHGSRIVFYAAGGPTGLAEARPDLAAAGAEQVEFEILLPTDEATLRPVLPEQILSGELARGARTVCALWKIRGLGLPLDKAVPLLESIEPTAESPGLRAMILAARLVARMLRVGEYAPAKKGHLRFQPHWSEKSVRMLSAIVQLVPESLQTARFLTQDDPVYSVPARNLLVSFVGHALEALAASPEYRAGFEEPALLPREFWRPKPQAILEILAPDKELEEGVPWGIQLLFAPVPGLPVRFPLEELKARVASRLFGDALQAEALVDLQRELEDLCKQIPALRRGVNMHDGKASLNRQELDQLLDHFTLLEGRGFVITLPGLERMQRLAAHVSLQETKGQGTPLRPWFEFHWNVALGDRQLTQQEFDQLVAARTPLVFLDRTPVLLAPKDREALAEFRRRAGKEGKKVTFFEALRLKLGGAAHLHGLALESLDAGPRLETLAQNLERARTVQDRPVAPGFVGTLRPYQARGHAWLYFLLDQGFGACLADDMGLGKTVQAISVILDWQLDPARRGPILLVCPVSVLGNWRRELLRFSPALRVVLHHGKGRARTDEEFDQVLKTNDILLTSFNLLQRDEALLTTRAFEGVILDEAQNIKNPATRQSRAARLLRGNFKLALTGTPLENRPLDLWSIMDFLNEGLLGTRSGFLQSLEHPIVKQRNRSTASTLARLVRPFVLRRLKTDPEIITDLPDKTEQVVVASLTREQAILYEAVVRKGLTEVENAGGSNMARRGAILTTLLRLKQVCNHPAHYLMDGSALPGRSGKLDLLTEMLEEALDEGDRCLVFTQFKEMGTLLKTHVEGVIGGQVLFLHGGVPQKERETMVAGFQAGEANGPKIFVLSLKAGGTGLNLTMANRVFHYDRWWNPAVEDQATDRAFRIGQSRNVFVHKFVCTGTLEERIQAMLEQKREVANTLLGAGESWLTELSNDELRRLVTLDRKEALA
jgi:hypothetical protein